MRTIALYATESMADWEYAYLTTMITRAEQTHAGRFRLVLVGDSLAEVRSLGGLPIRPAVDLADLAEDGSLAALVIPGGDHYESGHERLLDAVTRLVERGVPVAAICGATYLLSRAGFLDDRRHTSNDPTFLAMSGYAGAEHYVAEPTVTDRGITTGSGVHPVPFTAEVMRVTDLFPATVIDPWQRLYETGESAAFFEFMEATDAWQAS